MLAVLESLEFSFSSGCTLESALAAPQTHLVCVLHGVHRRTGIQAGLRRRRLLLFCLQMWLLSRPLDFGIFFSFLASGFCLDHGCGLAREMVSHKAPSWWTTAGRTQAMPCRTWPRGWKGTGVTFARRYGPFSDDELPEQDSGSP